MRNVLKILKRDLLRLLKTPQALVVVFALMVIPSLYTWYNVIGFWNPYDNTGNLTVCVVNQDAGGSSELTGELNVGERIVDQLHENSQLHWEFTDYDAAMNELKSGRAYAAYVIPEHFTADLLTITTGSFTQPKIEYYVNEKSGPVAPKITDTGATTLDETINSTFVATVSDVVVKTIDEKVNEGRESTKEMQSKAAQKISEAVAATGEVSEASAGIDAADKSLGQMGETATAMQKTLSDFSAFALPAVTAGLDDITQASNDATSAAARLTAAFGEAQGGIQAALAQGSAAVQESGQLSSSVRAAAGSLPAGSSERAALEALADSLDERTRAASTALDALTAANDRAQSSAAALSDAASALDGAVRQATSGASAYSTTLFGTTLPAVNDALDALAETSSALSGALETQRLLVAQTGLVIDQLDATMDTAASAVAETDRLFAGLESELGIVYNDVLAFGTSDALSRLVGEGGLDADKIAAFMASPTEVVTEQLYPLNAYGSAMAPLFMNLTFWIGAFMLLVIMRQEADGEGIPGLTLAQRYWGRYLFLAAIAVMQAVICCVGVLALGVQTVSAPALIFAAALASLAYLSIIYAFSVTLQHIGKGICVVLVFAQIPGATGLYPIEMTSPFFQSIYPLFPFTYGIGAMREAICGFYGGQYVSDLLVLALFLVLFMALGLLIRPLMANVNRMVARQVRDGGLFNGEDVDIPVRPYRISQIMRALSDKDTYATALQQRYATFNRWYPRLMKGALVLGVAVPVVLAVIFALTPTEKVWLLTGWLIWIIVIFVALVVIESLRFSFERQLKLESLSDASLIDLYGATADVERAACMDARDAGFGGREHESDRDGARDGAEGEEARHE